MEKDDVPLEYLQQICKGRGFNDEFTERYDYSPIEHIKSRLKTADSIVRKLKADGYEVTIENMKEKLSDIAGIRIICSFMSDIYQIADMIAKQADVTVLYVKDYIKKPKPNGYKSYHMVVTIPVYLTDGPVETIEWKCNPYRSHGFLGQFRA